MACSGIETGLAFLSRTMAYMDCQAQTLGSYGYGALADAGSPINSLLTVLLTLCVALYGLKLLIGHLIEWPEVASLVLKIGIVLTLATSWPAWRTVGFDVLMHGPFEIAQTISPSTGLTTQPEEAVSRLQAIDDAIVVMTSYGTGRLTGGTPMGEEVGDTFKGIALADQFALGVGRAAYLIGILLPFGIFRLGAGLLLALAPLLAGFLLFSGTSPIFFGWVRALIFCAIGMLIQWLVQGVQIDLFQPWLAAVVSSRQSGSLTPSAPTELLVLAVAFSGIGLGLMALVMRFIFHPVALAPLITGLRTGSPKIDTRQSRASELQGIAISRSQETAAFVSNSLRTEQARHLQLAESAKQKMRGQQQRESVFVDPQISRIGSDSLKYGGRRAMVRQSGSMHIRDGKS